MIVAVSRTVAMPAASPEIRPAVPGIRRFLGLATVSLAVTLIVMDGSIVNVALPTLVRELGGASNRELQWIVDAYILSFATLLISMGSAADRIGRRRMLVAGALIFAATSVAAAFAGGPGPLVAWRAAMGVGAAMVFPATLAILVAAFPEPRLRRLAIGVWAGCSGLGVAIGPVVGGWILRHCDWGAIFLVNVPLVALIAIGASVSIDESTDSRRKPFDLAGNALAVFGLLALVWALIEAPERGWSSWPVVAAAGLGLLLLAAFLRHEAASPAPMLDLRLVRSPSTATASLAIASAFFGLFGFVFLVTQFLQFVRGHDALEAGLRTLPFAGAIVAGAAFAGCGARSIAPGRACAAGLLLMSGGFAWAAADSVATPYAELVGQMALLGVGLGVVSSTATSVIMGSLAGDSLGLASSLNDTARELGGTIGVAVMGSVFNAVYRAETAAAFDGSPLPAAAREAVRQSLGVAIEVAAKVGAIAGPDAAARVRGPVFEAFIAGFRASSLVAAGLAAAGAIVVAYAMPRPGRVESGERR